MRLRHILLVEQARTIDLQQAVAAYNTKTQVLLTMESSLTHLRDCIQ